MRSKLFWVWLVFGLAAGCSSRPDPGAPAEEPRAWTFVRAVSFTSTTACSVRSLSPNVALQCEPGGELRSCCPIEPGASVWAYVDADGDPSAGPELARWLALDGCDGEGRPTCRPPAAF